MSTDSTVPQLPIVSARSSFDLVTSFASLPGNIVVEDILAWRSGADDLAEVGTYNEFQGNLCFLICFLSRNIP